MDDVDAGFFDAADVEGVGVDELHDDYAEDVFVGESGNRKFLLGAARLVGMTRGLRLEWFRLASLRRDGRGARRHMVR